MDQFNTYNNEDWTQAPAMPVPDYLDPFISGTLFKEYPQVVFQVVLQPIDLWPQTYKFAVIKDRTLDTISTLKAFELDSLFSSNRLGHYTDEIELLVSKEQLFVPAPRLGEAQLEELHLIYECLSYGQLPVDT